MRACTNKHSEIFSLFSFAKIGLMMSLFVNDKYNLVFDESRFVFQVPSMP